MVLSFLDKRLGDSIFGATSSVDEDDISLFVSGTTQREHYGL